MERRKQTGHICRWMAVGIMLAVIIVGCTIMIGLFEWRDRKEIESRNQELHHWQRDVHELNMHIAELSLLGETVADWDSTDAKVYHILRGEVDSMLQGIAGICPQQEVNDIRQLLTEKEMLLLQIKNAVQERNDIHNRLTVVVLKIVTKSKTENKQVSSTPQAKKRGFFSRLFGKKKKVEKKETAQQSKQTTQMLSSLHQNEIVGHQKKQRQVADVLDSLSVRNEAINEQLKRMMSNAYHKVENGIVQQEQRIASLENNYTYYYIGMFGLLMFVLFVQCLLVWRFAFRTRKGKEETRKVMLTVTHEMRSPLSAIKDYARKIAKQTSEQNESNRYATKIVETSKGLTTMIDSFLTYFKLENGKTTLNIRPFRLVDIAEQLKLEYELLAAHKRLDFVVENHAKGVVNGDKEKVVTIGRNLLSNAIKFTDKGEVVLTTRYEKGELVLAVKDTGTGMDEHQRKRIFKEFARLGNAVTQSGFGLGLSIVSNLVSLMKGRIEVASQKGLGSIFTVTLPLPLAKAEKAEKEQTHGHATVGTFSVIAIDDSDVQLCNLRNTFASYGIECHTCNQASELMDMMRKKTYDLLITDLKMAEVNGLEILEMVRMVNVRNSKSIPIIVMTAAPNVSEKELLEEGFSACLFKPMSDKDLIETAKRCVRGKVADKAIDFSMLLAYGDARETLDSLIREVKGTLDGIREAARKESRTDMADIIHHARSSWMLVQSDEPLNKLFVLIDNPASSDEDINQAVKGVVEQGDAILVAAEQKIKEVAI